MAGLITVDKEKTWSAANWVFDHILRVSRKHLPPGSSAKIVELIDNVVPGLNFLSLENLSPEELQSFRKALEDAYQEILQGGKESFGEPEFYSGFMQRFEELRKMIPTEQS